MNDVRDAMAEEIATAYLTQLGRWCRGGAASLAIDGRSRSRLHRTVTRASPLPTAPATQGSYGKFVQCHC
jgi:hypothetical protein